MNRFVSILLPFTLRGCQRVAQIDVPFVHREGVAPASFHLGRFGIRICETVAAMRNGALHQIDPLPGAQTVQLGAQPIPVKWNIQGLRRQ